MKEFIRKSEFTCHLEAVKYRVENLNHVLYDIANAVDEKLSHLTFNCPVLECLTLDCSSTHGLVWLWINIKDVEGVVTSKELSDFDDELDDIFSYFGIDVVCAPVSVDFKEHIIYTDILIPAFDESK